MEIVLVNGSNSVCRGLIKYFTTQCGTRSIYLHDKKPNSQMIKLLEEEGKTQFKLQKNQYKEPKDLVNVFKGAELVLYVTDDSVSSTQKNKDFQQIAEMVGEQGPDKFMALFPIENDNYNTLDAYHEKLEIQNQVMKNYSQDFCIIMNINLSFENNYSNMIQYISQCVLKGEIPKAIVDCSFKFSPISAKDLGIKILCEAESFSMDQIKRYTISGNQDVTLKQIMNQIEHSLGKPKDSTKIVNNNGEGDLTLEKNMILMAKYFDKHPELHGKLFENEIHKKMGAVPVTQFLNYYEKGFDKTTIEYPSYNQFKLHQFE